LFVRTLDKKWIALDRIVVISNREKYRDKGDKAGGTQT